MSDLAPSKWFDYDARGLIAKDSAPQEVWEKTLGSVLRFTKVMPWLIGDLLNYGEAAYGEKYTQAIEMTGLKYERLAQYCSVAKAFPYEQRDPTVDYSYYRRLKSIKNQETRQKFLDAAIEGEYTSEDELRDAIQKDKRPPDLTQVLCPCCRSQIDEYSLPKGKCQECDSKADEWARRFNKLFDAASALRNLGDATEFDQFCTRYNIESEEE